MHLRIDDRHGKPPVRSTVWRASLARQPRHGNATVSSGKPAAAVSFAEWAGRAIRAQGEQKGVGKGR
jgi:hypothetical protein